MRRPPALYLTALTVAVLAALALTRLFFFTYSPTWLQPRALRLSYADGVTLCLLTSPGGLSAAAASLAVWGGPVAVAVALAADPHDAVAPVASVLPSGSKLAHIPGTLRRDGAKLRNAALALVETRLALLLDNPSDAFPDFMMERAAAYMRDAAPKTVLAIPIFEPGAASSRVPPRSKAELLTRLAAGEARPPAVQPGDMGSAKSCVPHLGVGEPAACFFDFAAWQLARKPYFRSFQSPFMHAVLVVALDEPCLPAYDERFLGGGHLPELVQHLYVMGFNFMVRHSQPVYHRLV
jgi:hypothetical protein